MKHQNICFLNAMFMVNYDKMSCYGYA